MNVLLCLSHSIEEYDQVRLMHSLGLGVSSIGGYIDPANPHDPKRPALPDVPMVPEVKAAVDAMGSGDNLGAAQSHIPDAVLDWLGDDGVIVYHHYLERLIGQWPRIRDWKAGSSRRRVIWRTVGQSVQGNELAMAPLHDEGLEIVRYSPMEANIPSWCGMDALIRFWKDPEEWSGWTGEDEHVLNITQGLRQREPYTNWRFWDQSTRTIPRLAAGPGSELLGGTGQLSTEAMQTLLRRSRAYLYTGTQPASYTLGLIEAMMTGIPVVSIGPAWMGVFPYGPSMFEGHLIAEDWTDDPAEAQARLRILLNDPDVAREHSATTRARAIDLFGRDRIASQWATFLGVRVGVWS